MAGRIQGSSLGSSESFGDNKMRDDTASHFAKAGRNALSRIWLCIKRFLIACVGDDINGESREEEKASAGELKRRAIESSKKAKE